MASTADARKRREHEDEQRDRIEAFQRQLEQQREATQQALERVYSGAGFLEADAFLDALRDLGGHVEVAR